MTSSERPLHVLRTLAETTARHIVSLEAPPEAPGLPSGSIQLLAGAYVELRDQVRALHDLVDQTNPNDPIGTALTRVGLAQRPPDWPPRETREPRLVRAPAEVAKLSSAELLAIYCRAMRETEDVFIKYESYIVRLWDGSDGCWTDCTGEVDRDKALQYWAEKTDGGTRNVSYAEMDFFRIFPGGTHMLWDGSEGGEMHR